MEHVVQSRDKIILIQKVLRINLAPSSQQRTDNKQHFHLVRRKSQCVELQFVGCVFGGVDTDPSRPTSVQMMDSRFTGGTTALDIDTNHLDSCFRVVLSHKVPLNVHLVRQCSGSRCKIVQCFNRIDRDGTDMDRWGLLLLLLLLLL